MSEARLQRRVDDLLLQLKGLVHVRALLELRGVAAAELEREADRVRAELARLARVRAALGSRLSAHGDVGGELGFPAAA